MFTKHGQIPFLILVFEQGQIPNKNLFWLTVEILIYANPNECQQVQTSLNNVNQIVQNTDKYSLL
jgi:hypothetical protein